MKFNEGRISSADAKEVFKVASNLNNNPIGRVFSGLRKDKIDINDLQQAWKDEGFPDDTKDIAAILKGHGFSKNNINKVFKKVFGIDKAEDEYSVSPAIQRIVTLAKDNDIVEPLKAFLQKEFKFTESYAYNGKVVVEDIREIFTSIIQEERSNRTALIKTQTQAQLGRTKK